MFLLFNVVSRVGVDPEMFLLFMLFLRVGVTDPDDPDVDVSSL